MKIKAKFKGGKPSISLGSTSKKTKKVKSKAASAIRNSDDDVSSDDMYSDASDESGAQDEFFHKQSNKRFSLERTWSVNAFQISSHSAGVVYLDDSNSENDSENDTDDDSSSYDEFGSDDLYVSDDEEEDNTTAKMTNRKKADKTGRSSSYKKSETKKSTMNKYKKELKQLNNAPEVIPEGNEDDEMDDMSDSNENDYESDDNSTSCYQTPFSSGRPPIRSRLSSEDADGEDFDSGYSSDSALVRKRMAMIQQQQADARGKKGIEQSSNHEKKKKCGKKKLLSKKKEKKKGIKNRNNLEKENSARSGGGSLEGDSTVTTISVESEEEVRQSQQTKVEKNGKKKKKKKKKKKNSKDDNLKDGNPKDGKKKKKRAVISFLVDGDDEACADFDKRLEEIERFEAALVEERKSIQKERETMAFERESMEMRLDEEAHHCDELNQRINELEHLVQSQQISNAGNVVESIDEKQLLKMDFAREKREFHLQLVEKEREIADLKLAVEDQKMFQDATKSGEDNIADGKSRERLQGELLQTVAKLTQKEVQLKSQAKELDLAREEIASLKTSSELLELKKSLAASEEDANTLQQELDNERKENIAKLKDKDETVTFLMNELARLKKSKGR